MENSIGRAMVVGAGIGGIRAALDLAETGYRVTLIDRAPQIGGVLSQLDYQFPTDRCGMCKMLPLADRDAGSQYCLRKGLFHENIDIRLSTELLGLEGEPGHFNVTLGQKPKWVKAEKCIGCGKCAEICPVSVVDQFNAGLATRKAIYLPIPHAIPNPYIVDTINCTRCGACVEACPTDAITLAPDERKKFRILVVDDEKIVRQSLQELLDEEGFSAESAASGPEALEKLEAAEYDLMLVDIKMPGMDGVEVLQKATDAHPDLGVVMMTAFATVETAVEAMKIGARDYLIKPFEPDTLIPMMVKFYEMQQVSQADQLEVGALVLSAGSAFFDPAQGNNTYGYGTFPGVVTSLEFERMLSGSGPTRGKLLRPSDGRPISRIAWIQCVGSRDLQYEANFCSNACCMISIKEALLAQSKSAGLQSAIFYMDMRTFGKGFQRYRDRAEAEGVRLIRSRVHSVVPDEKTGDLSLRYTDISGNMIQEAFDLIVLAVGQRPAPGTAQLAETLQLEKNRWGFIEPLPFYAARTGREGIFMGGAFGGFKDISESVIEASAAAANAGRLLHASGASRVPRKAPPEPDRELLRELPRIFVGICTCSNTLGEDLAGAALMADIKTDPAVAHVEWLDQTCTEQGWEKFVEAVCREKPNRVLLAACLPYVYARKVKELARAVELDPALIEVVDIRSILLPEPGDQKEASKQQVRGAIASAIKMGLARLKRAAPVPPDTVSVIQEGLVIGGGLAGMTAALTIADHGFPVTLIEQSEHLGGNLNRLYRTLEGGSPQVLLEETLAQIEKHPLIRVHTETRLVAASGQAGHFISTFENSAKTVTTLDHGVTILASGGSEAKTEAYGYGTAETIVTQQEFNMQLNEKGVDLENLDTVVMIQCVDSREEPRNYCSRVCCKGALKNALYLKEQNSDITVYILYRDMMSYGFSESYYTEARKKGVVFIQYTPERKPEVRTEGDSIEVLVEDPIIREMLSIAADWVVLGTGIVPNPVAELARAYGADVDRDGFFLEAESKWRPLESLNQGVFACGLAQSPRTLTETISTAEAVAQRALRILTRKEIPAGRISAGVHHALCSLCERCIETCPYDARSIDEELQQVRINPLKCQGCGACAAVCPNGASFLEGFPAQQMLEVIDAALARAID